MGPTGQPACQLNGRSDAPTAATVPTKVPEPAVGAVDGAAVDGTAVDVGDAVEVGAVVAAEGADVDVVVVGATVVAAVAAVSGTVVGRRDAIAPGRDVEPRHAVAAAVASRSTSRRSSGRSPDP